MINPHELTDLGNEKDELLEKLNGKKEEKFGKPFPKNQQEDPPKPGLFIDCYGSQIMPIHPNSSNNGDKKCNIPMEHNTKGGHISANNKFASVPIVNGNRQFNEANSLLPTTAGMPITTQPTNNINVPNLPTNFTNSTKNTDDVTTKDGTFATNIGNSTQNIDKGAISAAEAKNSMENSVPIIVNDHPRENSRSTGCCDPSLDCRAVRDCDCSCLTEGLCGCFKNRLCDCQGCLVFCSEILQCCNVCCRLFTVLN